MSIKPCTKTQDKAVSRLRKAGKHTKEIAEELKLTVHQVYHSTGRARRHGAKGRKTR